MKVIKKPVKKSRIKRFDFVKKAHYFGPMKYVAYFVAKMKLRGAKIDIRQVNTEGLKPPYFVLANHASEFDMAMSMLTNYPHRTYNVVALDGLYDYTETLMRSIGTIAKRKFIKDLALIKNMKYVVTKCKDAILMMYPEAKYSLQGATSYLPPTLGKLAKFLGVPLVVINLRGCYVNAPQWHKIYNKRPTLEAVVTQVATAEEVKSLSEDELQRRIVENFAYDDFKWQKENNVVIDVPYRAQGLNRILYKCPHCGAAHQMHGEGIRLTCLACGKTWEMSPLGELKALGGETEFSHIPDWFDWEKADVEKRVREGTYRFEDEVRVKTMPNAQHMYVHPNGRLVHDNSGFTFTGRIYDEDVTLHFDSKIQDGVHIEYPIKRNDYTDSVILYTQDESYYLMPVHAKDVITEISLATDAIYAMRNEKK